jgi:hypothetical protein
MGNRDAAWVCQGVPGAGTRHDSMRDTSGRELRRLTPVIQQATAQYEHWEVENQEDADEQHATLSASLSLTRRTAHRRDCPVHIKCSHKMNTETTFIHYMLTSAKTTHN